MRDSSIADSADIKFACPHCAQRIVVERSAAGVSADCPVCRRPVTVPLHDTPEEPTPAAAAPQPETTDLAAAASQPPQPASELEKAWAETARQHALFKKAVDECERLKANATHIQAELKSFQADRQQLKADAAQARQSAATVEAELSEVTVALANVQQENIGLRNHFEAQIGQLHTQISNTESRLASSEQDVREREAELAKALRNLAKTKSDLSASVGEAAGLKSELEAHQQGLQTTGQQLSTAKSELRDALTRLGSLTEEHQVASEQRDAWQQRAEDFEKDLKSIDSGRDLLDVREKLAQLQKEYQTLETTLAVRTEEAAKSTDALRGIVARQNTTLGVYHSELRRLRRARFGARLVYGLFALVLLIMAIVAFKFTAPDKFEEVLKSTLHSAKAKLH